MLYNKELVNRSHSQIKGHKTMDTSRILSRIGLSTLAVAPLGLMVILAVTVLLPSLKDPESKVYSSMMGYPSLQRLAGQSIKVQTVLVSSQALSNPVAAPGESVALQQVNVRPLVSGPVEKVYVVEGQRVQRGEPLMQMRQFVFQNAVDVAQNNVAIATATLQDLEKSSGVILRGLKNNVDSSRNRFAIATAQLKQVESLVREGAFSQFQQYNLEDAYMARRNELDVAEQELQRTQLDLDKQLSDARLQLQNAKTALENALDNLKHTVIYASTDGLVSQVNIHEGEIVDATQPTALMTLSQSIVFKTSIDQARLNDVKLNSRATVRLVAFPGMTYTGRVIRLNPTVETGSTENTITALAHAAGAAQTGVNRQYTYSAWIEVNDLQMPPGLQGYAQFDQGNTSLVIPENAVTHLSAGEGMVMVVEGGRAAVRRVKLGKTISQQRQVLAGLKPGDRVVLSPMGIEPGDRLEI
jgi:HlyD family secretion protein